MQERIDPFASSLSNLSERFANFLAQMGMQSYQAKVYEESQMRELQKQAELQQAYALLKGKIDFGNNLLDPRFYTDRPGGEVQAVQAITEMAPEIAAQLGITAAPVALDRLKQGIGAEADRIRSEQVEADIPPEVQAVALRLFGPAGYQKAIDDQRKSRLKGMEIGGEAAHDKSVADSASAANLSREKVASIQAKGKADYAGGQTPKGKAADANEAFAIYLIGMENKTNQEVDWQNSALLNQMKKDGLKTDKVISFYKKIKKGNT